MLNGLRNVLAVVTIAVGTISTLYLCWLAAIPLYEGVMTNPMNKYLVWGLASMAAMIGGFFIFPERR